MNTPKIATLLTLLFCALSSCNKKNKSEEISPINISNKEAQITSQISDDLKYIYELAYKTTDSRESILHADKLIESAKKTDNSYAQALGYYLKGYVYRINSQYDSAIFNYYTCIIIKRLLNDSQGINDCYLGIARSYYKLQFFDRAKEYYELFIDNAQLINNKSDEAEGYRGMALVYRELNEDPNKVILFYKKALVLHEELNNPIGMASCYNGIANTYYTLSKDYTRAKEYYLQAVPIFETNNKQQDLADVYYNLGLIHKALNEFAKAKDYFSKTIELSTSINYQELVICSHEWLGELAKISKNYPTAIKELTIAQQLAEQDKSGNITLLADITDTFSKLYEEMGDDSKAMDYVHKKEAWESTAATEKSRITKLLEKQRFDTVKWEDTVEKGKEDKGFSIWWYILSAVVLGFVAGVKGKKIYTGIENALSIIPRQKKSSRKSIIDQKLDRVLARVVEVMENKSSYSDLMRKEAVMIHAKLKKIEEFQLAKKSIPKRDLNELWEMIKHARWFLGLAEEKKD